MASILCNAFGNQALTYITGQTTWLALHVADPGLSGNGAEVVGAGYARKQTKWTNPSNKTIATTNAQIFHDMPRVQVTYLAVWTAQVLGQCLIRLKLSGTGMLIPEAGQFVAQAGDIAITL